MSTFTTIGASFIGDFMEVYIREAGRTFNESIHGSRKVDHEKWLSGQSGVLHGMRHGLAFYANQLRREYFEQLPEGSVLNGWVPALHDTDFIQWLKSVVERWQNDEWSGTSDAVFYSDMMGEFGELVFTEDIVESYESARRQSVRAGIMEPSAADLDWLREEYEAVTEPARKLEQLIERAQLTVRQELERQQLADEDKI